MERKLIGLKGENVRVSTKALVIDVHLRHRQIGGRGQLLNVKKGKRKLRNYHFNLIHCGVLIMLSLVDVKFSSSANDGRHFHPAKDICK